ncbi:hypothetical protein [Pediococcus inopinatus]|uniref:hypothetical protein n=1 Tax=Pediococcus inopinatus TaxID=114090 RepID=UPI00336981A3
MISVEAVTKGTDLGYLDMLDAAKVLEEHKNDDNFKENIEALTRVLRISEKADLKAGESNVDPKLFDNESEQKMYDAVEDVRKAAADHTINENFQALQALRPLIDNYLIKL